ncbi:MAG: aldehyde ferredoxin oxidoreductase family protein [Thermorudis peleae]|nr:aldehyde ferredoxin oxidoreductase family protein [Thermorudis peleae]
MEAVHGQCLVVDLPDGTATAVALPELVFASVLGGNGLASYLLYRFCPPGADPLGPENPLIFATSPFLGTGLTTSSKLALAAKSPQTERIGDSISSSYLALALKHTGFDALVIRGQARDWSVLIVEDDQVRLEPADDVLGLDPTATADALRARLGRGFRVAAIGLAGERGVRFASISNDGRLAGRTGLGAVMGQKRLKAVAVRGTRPLPSVADPAAVAAAARALAARSQGPETAKYRVLGTVANVALFNRLGVLPTRNFQAGQFEGAEELSGEHLVTTRRVDTHACAACTIGCEHHFLAKGNGAKARLEYETLYALGPLCGIADPDIVVHAAALCDRYAMDAISAGGTIAWAMECVERGIALPGDPADWPRFGDGPSLLRALNLIGQRQGPLGALLAEGSRRAAHVLGQGSEAWAMHVKGLELPGYDPRKLKTMALGLAVATRGACHNRSSAYEVDFSDQLPPDAAARARAEAAVRAEDTAAVIDSLTLCKFLRHCFDDLFAEAAHLWTLVTGLPLDADGLRQAGARINTLKKAFNLREGWTRHEDTLPPRLLQSPDSLVDGTELDRLVAAYYAVRGWDDAGRIPLPQWRALGLEALLGPLEGVCGGYARR